MSVVSSNLSKSASLPLSTKSSYLKAKARRRSSFGGVLLEACIGLSVVFFTLILGFEFVKGVTHIVTGNYSVIHATRWAVLNGTIIRDLGSGPVELSRVASIKTKLSEKASTFGLSVDHDDVSICKLSDPNCTTDDAGNPNDMIQITWDYKVDLMFGYNFELEFSSVGQNEPA